MNISVSGIEEALAAVNRLSDIEGALTEGISDGAHAAAQSARELCPVRTGALRASIKAESSGTHAQISADCPYAGYVEFGTYKMAARPFMVPGLYSAREKIVSAVEAAIGRSL